MHGEDPSFDAIVIGTGFGGAVTACRLVQAGLRICVLERGRRFEADDAPVYRPAFGSADEGGDPGTDTDLSRLAWALGRGAWDFRDLGDAIVAQAAGYGGGSLIYANVHLRAPADVFAGWPIAARDLGAYYDLAAFMLQAEPMPESLLPRKTLQLRRATEKCRSTDGEAIFSFFRPPLAVRFPSSGSDSASDNRWGRKQGVCDLCADCCFGCEKQARNTLDTNYLAIVEDATDARGNPLADVRTQAEVVAIRASGEGHEGPYEVDYLDHCFERSSDRSHVTARAVFLCAGAVNTTELLLRARSARDLRPTGEPLGARFYGNADAPAVIFDAEELQESDRGPTIAGALLHRSESDWLMIQDGGLPGPLEPLLGLHRSPLLGGRNRFRESRRHREGRERGESGPQPLPFAPPPFGGIHGVLSQLERSSRTSRRSLAHVVSAELHRLGPRSGGGPGARPGQWALPAQLVEALAAGRDEVALASSLAAEPLVEKFLSRTAKSLENGAATQRIFESLGSAVQGAAGLDLGRLFLRLVVQQVWGSEAGLIQDLVAFALGELVPDPDAPLRHATDALRWALDYRLGDGHTAILLSMGRDREPGRLVLDDSGRLVARMASRLDSPETRLQERLLRDIAAFGLEGELRTNPTWTILDRRFTVHAQGGCPMGDGPDVAVTAPDGEVFGCPGLFVMDAAAFPTPVGVNPSATIAAVAERKVESFLRTRRGREGWKAPEHDEAQRWADARRADLDPFTALDPQRQHAEPISLPIGICFEERMEGFHAPIDAGGEPVTHRDAEKSGIRTAAAIQVELAAVIDDLAEFLARQERYEDRLATPAGDEQPSSPPPSIPLTGRLRICGEDATSPHERVLDVLAGSTMTLFSGGRRARDSEPVARFIDYRLVAADDARRLLLVGRKLLRDDPRLDAFEDSTTLFFDLVEEEIPKRRGILRLPAQAFFGLQLPSFRVTNTADPVRQTWALAAFGHFFLGRLVQVYAPELASLVPQIAKAARRTHV
ncbi:MAG: GMC family oxidoreductase [Deltaproteobacteria bacterium]|nr:GMC family oxidoreductase [Deltaproteobacteria bacterium]